MKKLSIIQKIKLLSLLNTFVNQTEEGITMKNSTKIVSAVVALLTGLLMNPVIQNSVMQFVSHYPVLSIIVTGVTTIGSLLHQPQVNTQNNSDN